MRLSFTALASCALALATIAKAAPTNTTSTVEQMATSTGTADELFPSEAVIAEFQFAEDEVPVLFEEEDGKYMVVLNSTLLEGDSLKKRDAEADAWHWHKLRYGQPIYKREADADAWHWHKLRYGQPIY